MIRSVALAAVLAVAVAGCAAPSPQAAQIRTTLTGTPAGFDLAADRGKAVYLEFLASPAATAALRRDLAAAGFQLATSRELERTGCVRAAERLRAAGLPCPVVSVGSTPTALSAARLDGVTEVRAGVYIEQPGPVATTTGRGPSLMLSLNPLAMLLGAVFSNAGGPYRRPRCDQHRRRGRTGREVLGQVRRVDLPAACSGPRSSHRGQ